MLLKDYGVSEKKLKIKKTIKACNSTKNYFLQIIDLYRLMAMK